MDEKKKLEKKQIKNAQRRADEMEDMVYMDPNARYRSIIKYSQLSKPLKFAVIMGWIVGAIYIFFFVMGFLSAF